MTYNQAKYVQEHRELSESIVIEVAEQLQKVKHYTEQEIYSYNENPQTDARILLYLTEIPYNYTGLKVVVNDNSTTYSDYFKIVFGTPTCLESRMCSLVCAIGPSVEAITRIAPSI